MQRNRTKSVNPPSPGTPGEGWGGGLPAANDTTPTLTLPRRPGGGDHRRPAFSLVEILVVIGIIALLLAILLPAIPAIRARAVEVACQAKLRAMGQLAQLHANAHQGYLPPAGWQWKPTGSVVNPNGMDDAAQRKYVYYDDAGEQRPIPMMAALALAAGLDVHLDSREALEEDMASASFRRLVTCPAQPEPPVEGFTQIASDGWQSPPELAGYLYNEALLGRRDHPKPRPIVGNLAAVYRAAGVFFAMDGQPRDRRGDRLLLIYDVGDNDTLYEWSIRELPSGNMGSDAFDYNRHRYRANVLFLDWHVQSIVLDHGDLATVGVSRGLYNTDSAEGQP
jgi:prepilin-type N-terminal cleavage/methylation domain-containing protein/prepilin-type processing-associated H-X9-DG protein